MARMTRTVFCIAAFFFAFVLLGAPAWAQTGSISGRVVDGSDQTPLPGANVVIGDTDIGTTTDANGLYEIDDIEPGTYTVVVTFVGYAAMSQQVVVEAGETVAADFALAPSPMQMEEVVTVGYGQQQRRDITGSVTSLSTEQIEEVPVSDLSQALQGNVAGVMALASGGRPGEGVTVRVRGRRSLTASNDPLYVVDGIPVEGNIDDINPHDIESMEVLKDASATAIYGSRGANGVILIETKRGGDHETMVSYSGYVGMSEPLGTPEVMSGPEFAAMKEVGGRTLTPQERENFENGVSTDWIDLVLGRGYQQSHQLSVRGGDERTQFAISGNYFDQRGVVEAQGFTRNTLRINLDHNVSDRLRVGTSTQLSKRVQDWGPNPYGAALATNPLARPYNEDGSLNLRPGADPLIFNPLADLVDNAYIDERSRLRVFGSLYADLQILDNLTYRVDFAPDIQEYRRGVFQSSETTARNGDSPYAEKNQYRSYTYTLENVLTYTKDVGDIHSFDLTGLYSLQTSDFEETDLQASQLPYETQLFHNIGSAGRIEGVGSRLEEWSLMSFMGRVNYQLMGKYLLTVTGRYDGSSRLAEGNKWGLFPSVALGWNISEEPFAPDLFSQLKLRVSYGVTGNTAIDPYQTKGRLNRTAYDFGGAPAFGYEPGSLSNPELEWEKSASTNIGLDFGLWNDRVTGSIELYRTRTTDLLLERNIPITSGFNSVFENIGETVNRGFEVSLSTVNVSTSDFSWRTHLNLFGNREEIVELYGTGEDDIGNGWFIGEPLTVWYDYDKIGVWQLDEADEAAQYNLEPGHIKVRDVNGDGRINEEDRVILGTDIPKLSVGFQNRFEYRNFDFSFFLFGSFGHTVFNDFEVANSTLQGRYNNLKVDYWTPDNPTNDHPKPDGSREYPLYNESRGYVPGDFLKVRNVRIGYTVPVSFMENNVGLSSVVRVYANAETPFIFSRLDNSVDPEQYGGVISADRVPTTRLFTVGVEVTL